MKTKQIKIGSMEWRTVQNFMVIALFFIVVMSCSKEDEGGGAITDSIYSGTGNFNFSGDFNESFLGNVQSTKISEMNGIELLPLNFRNSQGKELFIGLKSTKIEARAYNMKEIDAEGYSAIQFTTGLYDSGAIGGKGTVTITAINGNKINGSVDMRLARPLNTADTVIVKGSFQLKAQ